ncbi:MAG: response regulator transcription factor [Clostridia bacterium]
MRKKIIIVEDDKMLAQELKELLYNNGYESMIIEDFEKTTEKILKQNADMILLDINLPNINGEFLLKEIRKESNIPIIMVTSRDTEADEVISMSTGADDYITKPYNPTILLLRIEAILKRVNKENEKIEYRDVELDKDRSLIKRKDKQVILSKNEILIFDFLIKNQGKIVSRDDIINYLWDSEEFVDDNTLSVNMTRLRNKLAEIQLENVIETRRGQGYILL